MVGYLLILLEEDEYNKFNLIVIKIHQCWLFVDLVVPSQGSGTVGGYARSEGKDCYAGISKRSLMKQLSMIQDVKFEHRLFHEWSPKMH